MTPKEWRRAHESYCGYIKQNKKVFICWGNAGKSSCNSFRVKREKVLRLSPVWIQVARAPEDHMGLPEMAFWLCCTDPVPLAIKLEAMGHLCQLDLPWKWNGGQLAASSICTIPPNCYPAGGRSQSPVSQLPSLPLFSVWIYCRLCPTS